MKMVNKRDEKTLEPTFGIYITEDDVKRLRKLIKKIPARVAFIPLVDVSNVIKQLDQAIINTMGREEWEKTLREGTAPLPSEPKEEGK